MPIPKYFIHERMKALKEREKMLGQILAKLGPKNKDDAVDEVKMSLEDAVRMIQIHERARQGILIIHIIHLLLLSRLFTNSIAITYTTSYSESSINNSY